ncbi:hypothetical protein [Hydrogenophaga sp. T2]|uniref:hypothetical protein n=1 Tax=Hydrogenophaga sp. T2 TaxID=3132823 RepID=UPI003CE8D89A
MIRSRSPSPTSSSRSSALPADKRRRTGDEPDPADGPKGLAKLAREALAQDPARCQQALQQLFHDLAQGDSDKALTDALRWLLPPHAPAGLWSAAVLAAHRLTPVQCDYFIAWVQAGGGQRALGPLADHAWRGLCLNQALRRSLIDHGDDYDQVGVGFAEKARPAPALPAAPEWAAQRRAAIEAIRWTHFETDALVAALRPLMQPGHALSERLEREGPRATAMRLQGLLVAALQPGCLISLNEVYEALLPLHAPHLPLQRLPIDLLMVLFWVQDPSIEPSQYNPTDEHVERVVKSLPRFPIDVQAQALCDAGVQHLRDVQALQAHTLRMADFAATHPEHPAVRQALARWQALVKLVKANLYARTRQLSHNVDRLGEQACDMARLSAMSHAGAQACADQVQEIASMVHELGGEMPGLHRQVDTLRWRTALAQEAGEPLLGEWQRFSTPLVTALEQKVSAQLGVLQTLTPKIRQSTTLEDQLRQNAGTEAAQAADLAAKAIEIATTVQQQTDLLRQLGPDVPVCTATELLALLKALPAADEPWTATDLALLAHTSQLVALTLAPWPDAPCSAAHDLPVALHDGTLAALRHGCGLTDEGERFATGPLLDELDPAVLLSAFNALYEADKLKLVSGPVTRTTLPLQTAFALHPRIAAGTRRDTVARILSVRSGADTADEWERLRRVFAEAFETPAGPAGPLPGERV